MEFSLVTFFLIMVAMTVSDICFTLYFIDVEERRAHGAAFWSAMIILVTAFAVTNYVENKIYIVAAFIGAYVGTYVTIEWKKRIESRLKPELVE
ncbi:hypothetical protein [Nitrosomonas sp.]|uniref:hypothetical protein n=1 Tax=Nitrosomonas sp. TaxID=42353 RepID=UPI0025E99B44|nr:hypothetical protein [Nitrosomonas sp.]